MPGTAKAQVGSQRRSYLIAVGLITIVGTMVRLACASESLGWDELFMLSWVQDRPLEDTLDLVKSKEKTPPFGFLLAWIVSKVGGAPETLRLPSIVSGIALIPLAASLGARVWGRKAAVTCAALIAVSPFLVFYSVESRSYSLVAALALGSTTLLLRGVRSGGPWVWVGYGILSGLALMTHYIAAPVLLAQVLWVLVLVPDRRRQALLAQIPVLALLAICSPLIWVQFGHASEYLSRMDSVAPLTLETVTKILGQALVGQPFAYLREVPGRAGLFLIAAGALIAFGMWVTDWVRGSRSFDLSAVPQERALIAILALANPVMLTGVSLLPDQSILMPRNLIPSVPFVLVLIAAGLASLRGWRSIPPTALVIGGLSTGLYESARNYQRPQFKAAAHAVMERWQPGEPIVEVCCLAGQEGLPGVAIATYLPKRATVLYFKVLTSGGAEAIRNARIARKPFFLIWRDGHRGKMPSPASRVATGASPLWEQRWPGLFWVGAGEYR